jgi:hypothetical protein
MIKTIFQIIFLLTLLISLNLSATEVSGRLSITPIIGLESVQKFQPTPHMKTRARYGARAIYKFPISALEGEYTHAQDTSSDQATSTSYKDSEDKLRLGLRGSFTGPFISTYIRGGAQYRKNEQTRTISNATSTTSNSSKVQPYVGTGIDIRIVQYFSLTADILATYTPTSAPNLRDYELQPSIGVSLRF